MNIDSFLDRWRSYGPAKQLAVLLAVLTKRTDAGELRIPMSEIDDISAGETVVYMENARANEIILRFSPEYTTLYTIEESVHERKPWPSQSQESTTSEPSSASPQVHAPKTDRELAQIEEQVLRQQAIREEARAVRSGWAGTSPQPSKGKKPPARPQPVNDQPQ